jgi:phage tail sheath protein FI
LEYYFYTKIKRFPMPVQTSYPGVYVQELPSDVHTIVGVSTSIAMFIGRAKQGPTDEPELCLSYADYVRTFSADTSFSDLALQVQQFFLNGGSKCYVLRIVNKATAVAARAVLNTGGTTLTLEARSPGAIGNTLQCTVDYNTPNPESTFNLTVYTYTVNAAGKQVVGTLETFKELTMTPNVPKNVITYINQQSNVVRVPIPAVPPPPPVSNQAYSSSGRPISLADLNTLMTAAPMKFNIMVSLGGSAPRQVDLSTVDTSTNWANLQTTMQNVLNTAFAGALPMGGNFVVNAGFSVDGGTTNYIAVEYSVNGVDVNITPAASNDLASVMMWGYAQGGLEKSGYADLRPQPNGIVFDASLANIATLGGFAGSTLQHIQVNGMPAAPIATGVPTAPLFYRSGPNPPDVNGIRQNFGLMESAIKAANITTPAFNWTAQRWGSRLAILPAPGSSNSLGVVFTQPADIGPAGAPPLFLPNNVSYYAFGGPAQGGQAAGTVGVDGSAPTLTDYNDAFQLIDNEVDLFNLMILAKDNTISSPTSLATIWGPASAFCQQRRAMLLVDPPDTPDAGTVAPWVSPTDTGSQTAQKATDTVKGINALRQGLVNFHSVLYFPRVQVTANNAPYLLAPSGTMAGIMARTDANRGVWKAPAGTEANLIGVTGLEVKFTDLQNGVMNPVAVNNLRSFPDGIVSWGARTLDGDDGFQSQWKYVPVRRTALYIEESLYRGLKWVVFEPNDERLWSQIRLNVGAFMHGLFVQGAFQGTKKDEAYFVACDGNTTSQNDIDLGVVNVIVGFAPLKPAEFVILSIQQMAGAIQV